MQANLAQPEILRAPVGDIARALAGVDVVGEEATPVRAKAGAGHAAASEKFKESGPRHRPEVARVAPRRFPKTP